MSAENEAGAALDKLAVDNFRKYLQIPSVHPDVDYDPCVAFLEDQAKDLGLPLRKYHCFPRKPIVVLTWVGREPALPTILLNSHMDVVPVFEEKWTHDPFSAHVDEQQNIYARGAQDMKSVGIQYLEAVRRLRCDGVTLRRTVHISFAADEEVGGTEGMRAFTKTQDFRDLNVGFSLDEGMASPEEHFVLFYGERTVWHLRIHCPGQPGHASLLLEDTAGEKVRRVLDRFIDFRDQQKRKLREDPSLALGDVTSVNITQLRGGVQSNVVPPEMVVMVDCRVPVTTDIQKWEEIINRWCQEAGEGVRIEYEHKQPHVPPTKLDDSNPYWVAFKSAADELQLKLKPLVFPAGTDSQYVREVGLPAIGFSPINNTPVLLHDHDEYLNVRTFLRGIEIYCKLICAIANIEGAK